MSKPHLLNLINTIVEGQLSYQDMTQGQILGIHTTDAKSEQPIVLHVQVAAERIWNAEKLPVFQFLDGAITLYCDSPPTALVCDSPATALIRPHELALPGVSATHFPETDPQTRKFSGIAIGQDYSFEYVGYNRESLYVKGIRQIEVFSAPDKWKSPGLTVDYYLSNIETHGRMPHDRHAQREERLRREVIVQTKNTFYHFTAMNKYGERMLKRPDGSSVPAQLIAASVGGAFRALIKPGDEWETLTSMAVKSIAPDPDTP